MGGYGLLGRHLGHSYSAQIHRMIGDYPYELIEIEPHDLPHFLRSTTLDGMNVTIPYKKAVMEYCEELSDEAKTIGSVNTLVRLPSGGFRGENTDYYGFSYLLRDDASWLPGAHALVLGTGGASLTVQQVLRDHGVQVTVWDRKTIEQAKKGLLTEPFDVMVNATPVGMFPHNNDVPVKLFSDDYLSHVIHQPKLVADLIYNPARTELMLQARDLNTTVRGGLEMLVAQAVRAAELFHNERLSERLITNITERLSRETENIVLIGMPGSGKSTIARHLASITNRPFLDTDEIVEQAHGIKPARLLEQEGEQRFREIERDILMACCRESGSVIATGGGVVTIPANRNTILQNSRCIFIDRNLQDLAQEDRPLTHKYGLEQLYRDRIQAYQGWSEKTYDNTDAWHVACQIKRDYSL